MKDDEGSILLWAIGLLIVTASVMVGAISFTSYATTQHEVQTLADSMAIVAADSLNVDVFSDSGILSDLSLNAHVAEMTVKRLLTKSGLPSRLIALSVDGLSVTVTIESNWSMGDVSRVITASATAVAQLQTA